jgi:rubredoxin
MPDHVRESLALPAPSGEAETSIAQSAAHVSPHWERASLDQTRRWSTGAAFAAEFEAPEFATSSQSNGGTSTAVPHEVVCPECGCHFAPVTPVTSIRERRILALPTVRGMTLAPT